MNFSRFRTGIGYIAVALFCVTSVSRGAEEPLRDIVVYGGTSAGIAAAVQASRMGKSVVVIESTHRVGGLTSGGLGFTDIGNKNAIGGIAREFYDAVARYYAKPDSWKWQTRVSFKYRPHAKAMGRESAMWLFEPSVALKIYNDWIGANHIEVVYGERLDRKNGIRRSGTSLQIDAITMESGRVFPGKMFIDATYEGDLMAAAGVSCTVGRESNAQYGETFDGVQPKRGGHKIRNGVDPYVEKGKPASGLLPFINPHPIADTGSGDKGVQAYCFRMCLTDNPDNRIPFEKPAGYQEVWYELLFRNLEAGQIKMPWKNDAVPNRKTDTNNSSGVSTDFIGQNYDYPDASYAEREKIFARHLLYQKGLMWTLAYHPRVPEAMRAAVSKWGLCRDEFQETGGWPGQLYIREARRMISDHVMTQANCTGKEIADDAVGLAAYTMDSHNVQRYVTAEGFVQNEGDVQERGFPPYPISYRSIVPKSSECGNLLVPVCLSASHIAYGSIRMEPVFMVLGQSAATAAALAIDGKTPVQKITYDKLRQRLLDDKQVLAWTRREEPKAATPAP